MATSAFQSDGPSTTSTSLIQRIQVRDDVAWNRLVDLYSPLIWGWCRGFGLQPNDAEDVSQEVFAAIAGAIVRYQRTGSFRGWIWQVTRNKALDFFRRRNKAPKVPGGSDFGRLLEQIPETPPDDHSISVTGDPLVFRALELIRAEFEESTWTAFVRMAFEKRSAGEVAVELGWCRPDGSDSAKGAKRVRQAKFRIMKRLRDEFGDVLDLS